MQRQAPPMTKVTGFRLLLWKEFFEMKPNIEDMKRDYSKVYASFIPEGIDFDLINMLFCNEFGLWRLGLYIGVI